MNFKSALAKPHQMGGAWSTNFFKQSQLSRHHAQLSAALPRVLPTFSTSALSEERKHSALQEPTRAMRGLDLAIKAQNRMIKHQDNVRRMLGGTSKAINTARFTSAFPNATKPLGDLNRRLAETRKHSIALQGSAKATYAHLNSSRNAFEKGGLPALQPFSSSRFADQGKLHRTQATLLDRIARGLRNLFTAASKPANQHSRPGERKDRTRAAALNSGRTLNPPRGLPPQAKEARRTFRNPERAERNAQPRRTLPGGVDNTYPVSPPVTIQVPGPMDGLQPQRGLTPELQERLREAGAVSPPDRLEPVTRRADRESLQVELYFRSPVETGRVGEVEAGSGSVNISNVATRFEHNTYRGQAAGGMRGVNDGPSRGLLTRVDRRIGPNPDRGQNSDGSQINAFRHALWQALITRELGSDFAQQIGDAHEGGTRLSSGTRYATLAEADQQADLRNNYYGRVIGRTLEGEAPRNIALGVLSFFRDYGLFVARRDGNGFVWERQRITGTQFRAALGMLETTNNYGYTEEQWRAQRQHR